ncbi:MAG: PqqD family protein [Chloroflexi bacterium HGW-Chloroflexi-6]|nr:MAG: PqqD family protein [Chloroflexi bacterium HGW-Chloroflexi-6]
MLILETFLTIPPHVTFSVVGEDAFLLNTRNSKYYLLQEVGTRLWDLLGAGQTLRMTYNSLLKEYEVAAPELERDLLELVADLVENGLLEYATS